MEKVEEDGIYVCLGLALLIARKHSMTSQSRHLGHALQLSGRYVAFSNTLCMPPCDRNTPNARTTYRDNLTIVFVHENVVG